MSSTITSEQLQTLITSVNELTEILMSLQVTADPVVVEPVVVEPVVVEPVVVEPVVVEPVVVEPVVVEPVDLDAFTNNGINFYKGTNLGDVKASFLKLYGTKPVDNDRYNGVWYSGSKNFGESDIINITSTTNTTTNSVQPTTSTSNTTVTAGVITIDPASGVYTGQGWTDTTDGIKWANANRFLLTDEVSETGYISYTVNLPVGDYEVAIEGRAETLTPGRHDLANDVWFKMDGVFGFRKHYFNGNGEWHTSTTGEIDGKHAYNKFTITKAGTYTLVMSGRSTHTEVKRIELRSTSIKATTDVSSQTTASTYSSSMYKPGDLVSMHFDSSMDPDDLQAMIANRQMLDSISGVAYIVINGTRSWENTEIIAGSTEHCRTLFPDTLDAHASWDSTVATVATRWKQTLDAGGTVWVAEGGPADFTADVLRTVPSTQQQHVKVVQHAGGVTGFNEKKTKPSNMTYVKDNAELIAIGNGNHGGNGVGGRSPAFKQENGTEFLARAYNTKYAAQWKWAISEIYKTDLVDFSDTVELVYILGLHGTMTDYNDFADMYFK